jgi:hypothetical protein
MANTNSPRSFEVVSPLRKEYVHKFNNVKSGDTFKPGDVVYIDSSGFQTSTSGSILGIAMSTVLDTNGEYAATGGASNNYSVIVNTDPNVLMKAQITTYAITNRYTCATRTGCFDIAGATGVQYIDAGASSNDDIVVIGLSTEWDNGIPSVVGAYAKVLCMFNPARHLLAKNS